MQAHTEASKIARWYSGCKHFAYTAVSLCETTEPSHLIDRGITAKE